MTKEIKKMEETLNQEQQPLADNEGYFDDITEEEINELPIDNSDDLNVDDVQNNSEVEESEQLEQPQEEVEEQELPFLDIRYNKEDVHLNREQAIEYAQKGMNYDKVIEKYNGLNSNLERLASANGLSVDEYLDRLEETQFIFEVNQEMENLRNEYPDASDEILQRLAEQNVNTNRGNAQLERQAREEEQRQVDAEALQAQATSDIQRFKSLFPNVDPFKDLPQEVLQRANETRDLTLAYSEWRNKQAELNRPQLEAKAKVQQLNAQNANKSYGNTTVVDSGKQDDFLAGWNEE